MCGANNGYAVPGYAGSKPVWSSPTRKIIEGPGAKPKGTTTPPAGTIAAPGPAGSGSVVIGVELGESDDPRMKRKGSTDSTYSGL